MSIATYFIQLRSNDWNRPPGTYALWKCEIDEACADHCKVLAHEVLESLNGAHANSLSNYENFICTSADAMTAGELDGAENAVSLTAKAIANLPEHRRADLGGLQQFHSYCEGAQERILKRWADAANNSIEDVTRDSPAIHTAPTTSANVNGSTNDDPIIDITAVAEALVCDPKTVSNALGRAGEKKVRSINRTNAHAAHSSQLARAYHDNPKALVAIAKLTASKK